MTEMQDQVSADQIERQVQLEPTTFTTPAGSINTSLSKTVYPRGFKIQLVAVAKYLLGYAIDNATAEDITREHDALLDYVDAADTNLGETKLAQQLDDYIRDVPTGDVTDPLTLHVTVDDVARDAVRLDVYDSVHHIESESAVRFTIPETDSEDRALAREWYNELSTNSGHYDKRTGRGATEHYCLTFEPNEDETVTVTFSFMRVQNPSLVRRAYTRLKTLAAKCV